MLDGFGSKCRSPFAFRIRLRFRVLIIAVIFYGRSIVLGVVMVFIYDQIIQARKNYGI